ncbi:MAG TPA: hypothetical protein VMG09_07805 [Bacteroidota bacterium]|nr:hypothetical protein [Bacteroidota bacterium]
MKLQRILFLLVALAGFAVAQESDYSTLQWFETRSAAIKAAMDSVNTPQALDAIKTQIDALALDFQPKKDFLDKALSPDSFDGRIAALRKQYDIAYARTSTIQTQGVKIVELETTVAEMNSRLDTLSSERAHLLSDLQDANKTVASLRETVKRLNANLQANDRLLFSLIDSIFLPYDRNMSQATDIEKEKIAGNLQQSNVMARVYSVANDNVRFLETTQLQPKDYASLVDQYQAFRSHWNGLGTKLRDVAAAAERRNALPSSEKKGSGKPTLPPIAQTPPAQVDSVISAWNGTLMRDYWSSIEKEFTSKGINVNHFTDGPSFAASINALVASYKAGNGDVHAFVDGVWRERIDRDWRESLVKDGVLGRSEYAALDKTVSELGAKTLDFRLILYILGIIVIALGAWWVISRKPKAPAPPAAAA